jgi:hypothetical protein
LINFNEEEVNTQIEESSLDIFLGSKSNEFRDLKKTVGKLKCNKSIRAQCFRNFKTNRFRKKRKEDLLQFEKNKFDLTENIEQFVQSKQV